MAQIQLTKRNYLGVGYVHIFKHNKTGAETVVPCTKEEYEALGLPNAVNPTLDGHTWVHSSGGTIKVDSPTTILGENEYVEYEGKAVVMKRDADGIVKSEHRDKADIVADVLTVTDDRI